MYKSVLGISVRMYFFYLEFSGGKIRSFGIYSFILFFSHGIVEGKVDLPKYIEDWLTAKVLELYLHNAD